MIGMNCSSFLFFKEATSENNLKETTFFQNKPHGQLCNDLGLNFMQTSQYQYDIFIQRINS